MVAKNREEQVLKLSRMKTAKSLSTLPIGILNRYRLEVSGVKSCDDPNLVISISRCLHSIGSPEIPYPTVIEDVMASSQYYLNASSYNNLELLLNESDFLDT